jgi:hypothetical protein
MGFVVARGGNLEVFQWGARERMPVDERTCVVRGRRGGHLEALQWARANGCPWEKEVMCEFAAKIGHLEMAEVGCVRSTARGNWRTCWVAAEHGHLEVLKWARENGCPWKRGESLGSRQKQKNETCAKDRKLKNEDVRKSSGEGGHLEVMRWARENGCPWNRVDVRESAEVRPPSRS